MSTPTTVAVIGAGASGTLAAAQIARTAARTGTALDLLLVDPNPPGVGLAYATSDPRHRLNVPAKGMSAWPDDPLHFLRWLRRHVSCDFPETGFAPRLHYAQYLADVLDEALSGSPARLVPLPARATDLRPVGRRVRVSLADGTSRPADAVVLATGHGRPAIEWAPTDLRRAPQFVPDPWAEDADRPLRRGDEVVLVGAGLTAADMAQRWGRSGVRLHVVSRHGMLPLPHANEPATPRPPDLERLPRTLPELRHAVFAAIRAADGDWRRAIDGLRPVSGDLWRGLDDAGRGEFLRSAVRRWDRVRHRVDPALSEWLEQRRAEGSLQLHAGSVVTAAAGHRTARVTLSDGAVIEAAAVINCTGTGTRVSTSDDPLVLNLLTSGLAVADPLDLGFLTDGTGRLVSASGASPAVWTLGPLRRGELWETTAVPEIRVQAAGLARPVLESLPGPRIRRRPRDLYGLPLSTDAAAGAVYNAAIGRILRVQSGAEELLREAVAADPDFAVGQATLALLGAEWGVEVDGPAALAAAHAPTARADERERRFVEMAAARVGHPGAESAATLLAYLQAYPEDAFAVSIAVPTIAFGGATEVPAEAWALVEGLGAVYGDDWWYLGLLAFIRQEQERFAEAGELAARSLLLEPSAGHAVHAKAHVHYETGDHRAGLAWLDRWIATCGARASHRAHFAWHAALHELALGDDAAVGRRYAAQLAPPAVTGVRALVDSASLLWRARMVGGAEPGEIGRVLASVPAQLLAEPPTPFAALHAAVALAAAGDCRGLARLRRGAERRPEEPFRRLIAPLADALCDLTHGDAAPALDTLLALPDLTPVGGSAAQREVVEETIVYCAVEAGRIDVALDLLGRRLDRRESERDRRRRATLPPPR